ncbi:MAG: hypothetical protein KGL39_01375 [Patescibacteria group bacterium]|nr:hypothetical protein [Patescibacteria group bacterium]
MAEITLLQLVTILGNSGLNNGVESFLYWDTTTDQRGLTCDFYFVHIGNDYMPPDAAKAWRIRVAAQGIPVPDDDNEYNNVAVLQTGRLNGASYMFDNGSSGT